MVLAAAWPPIAVGVGVAAAVSVAWAVLGAAAMAVTLAGFRFRRGLMSSVRQQGRDHAYHWPLLVLPSLIGLSVHSTTIATVGLIGLTAAGQIVSGRRPRLRELGSLTFFLLAGSLMVWLRPNTVALQVVTFAIVAACATLILIVGATSQRSAVISVVDGVGIYLLVAGLSYVGGLRSPAEGIRMVGIESTFAVFSKRHLFPFATSFAATPAVAAAYVAAAAPLLIAYQRARWLRVAALLAAFGIMTAANSRVALTASLLVAGTLCLLPNFLRRVAVPVAAFLLVLPFVYPTVHSALSGLEQVRITGVTRQGEQVASLNNRDFIWERSIHYFGCCLSTSQRIIGAGQQGHVVLGVSDAYRQRFARFAADARILSPHNSSLQVLFDSGIVGLLTMSGVMIIAVRRVVRLSMRSSPIALSMLGAMVALLSVGTTEVVVAAGPHQAPWWLLLAVVATISSPFDRSSATAPATRRDALLPSS